MSNHPPYARVLYTYADADGIPQVIAVHADLAYFPNALEKPAADADNETMTSFFNQYLAQGRTPKPGMYVTSVTRTITENGTPFFDVRLTPLGASAVQSEYGVKPHRFYPIYIIYTPFTDRQGVIYKGLSADMQAALATCALMPRALQA